MNKTQQLLKERSELFNKEFTTPRGLLNAYASNNPDVVKSFHTTTISLLLNSLKEETEKRKQADECICGIKETCMGQCSGGYNSALSDISTLLSETISNIQKK